MGYGQIRTKTLPYTGSLSNVGFRFACKWGVLLGTTGAIAVNSITWHGLGVLQGIVERSAKFAAAGGAKEFLEARFTESTSKSRGIQLHYRQGPTSLHQNRRFASNSIDRTYCFGAIESLDWRYSEVNKH